jgi:hypothetical protein
MQRPSASYAAVASPTLPDPHFARPLEQRSGAPPCRAERPLLEADIARLVVTLEQTRLDLSRTGDNPNLLVHAFNMDERTLDNAGLALTARVVRQEFVRECLILRKLLPDPH